MATIQYGAKSGGDCRTEPLGRPVQVSSGIGDESQQAAQSDQHASGRGHTARYRCRAMAAAVTSTPATGSRAPRPARRRTSRFEGDKVRSMIFEGQGRRARQRLARRAIGLVEQDLHGSNRRSREAALAVAQVVFPHADEAVRKTQRLHPIQIGQEPFPASGAAWVA